VGHKGVVIMTVGVIMCCCAPFACCPLVPGTVAGATCGGSVGLVLKGGGTVHASCWLQPVCSDTSADVHSSQQYLNWLMQHVQDLC
jgi:hypothetical protein